MDEGDERTVRTRTWHLVDQAHATRLELRQGGDEIRDPERKVVDPRSAPGDIPGNRRILGRRLQQFQRDPSRIRGWWIEDDEVRPDSL